MEVLAFGPHPDDIEFGCFGTLFKYYKENHANIHLVVISSGELGGESRTREEESLKASIPIEADVLFLREPDGSLVHDSQLVSKIRKEIKRINPDVVFCPFYEDTHQDHIYSSRAVLSSSKLVQTILFYETPSTINFLPNVFYDVTGYIDEKIDALKKHNSQLNKPYFDIEQIKGLGEYRAWQCHKGDSFYEAFQLFKALR